MPERLDFISNDMLGNLAVRSCINTLNDADGDEGRGKREEGIAHPSIEETFPFEA